MGRRSRELALIVTCFAAVGLHDVHAQSKTARAWGPIETRLFNALSTVMTNHSYVLLGGTAPPDVRLQQVSRPGTYELTLAADAGPLPTPRTFLFPTAVGSCVLSSSHTVWVSNGTSPAQRGIDFSTTPCGDHAVSAAFAIEGPVDAFVAAPQDRAATDEELAWIARVTGKTPQPPYEYGTVARARTLALSNLTALETAFAGAPRTILLRRGAQLVGSYPLTEVSAEVRWAGRTSLVLHQRGKFVVVTP